VTVRRPLSRVLLGGALLGAGALAVIGGLAVRGPGLVGVCLAATLAGCTAAGIARESSGSSRGSALEAAVWATGCTAGAVLVVAGVSTVAGGMVAGLAVVAAVVGFLVFRLGRGSRAAGRAAGLPVGEVLRLPVTAQPGRERTPNRDARLLAPVSTLSTRALGDEWLRTTAALAGRLTPAVRAVLVSRRGVVLDELERRDPEGFARWLAAGPTRGSDPAGYVRGGPPQRGPAADTDAA
jgi:hypothetical protein